MCSGGTEFVMTGVGIGGRPTRLEGAGLGVVVRVPGARSVCAGVEEVCCGKLPEGCDFASFLSSFCTHPSPVSNLADQSRLLTFLLLSSRACGVSDISVFTFHCGGVQPTPVRTLYRCDNGTYAFQTIKANGKRISLGY